MGALPRLYRQRFIPLETVELRDDTILKMDQSRIITSWRTLKPRKDFAYGNSVYHMDLGIKVSRFYRENGEFVYYYCDIIKTSFHSEDNKYVFSDLLADVVVYPDGRVMIMDVGEIAHALDMGLITVNEAKSALLSLDFLLHKIYNGGFSELSAPIDAC